MAGIDANAMLVMHYDNNLGDAAVRHSPANNGGITFSSAVKKWGYSGNLADSKWISIPDSDDFNFGSGQFTVETFIRFSTLRNTFIVGQYTMGNNINNSWVFYYSHGSTRLSFTYSTTGSNYVQLCKTWSPSVDTWYHIAVCRGADNVLRFYVDGTSIGTSTAAATFYNSSKNLLIGKNDYDFDGYWYLDGYLDETRISDISRYPSDFTPLAEPFTGPVYVCNQSRHSARESTAANNQTVFDMLRDTVTINNQAQSDIRESSNIINISQFSAKEKISIDNQTQFDIRESTSAKNQSQFLIREKSLANNQSNVYSMQKRGWHIYAKNVGTSAVSDLGFIDADLSAANRKISDAALADGTYEIEARPAGLLWDACHTRKFMTVKIGSDIVVISGLPEVRGLEREIISGNNIIRWYVLPEYTTQSITFGLWLSDTSPVVITGTPDYTVAFSSDKTRYKKEITQTATKYISVAAYSGSDQGAASELLLPWSSATPDSPINQRGD